jgi:hypothetical protein
MNVIAQQQTSKKYNSAATVNATQVQGSPARLMTIVASNINAADRYLKLYDKAAAPVVGTDVPVLTVKIPAGGTPVVVNFGALGLDMAAGIGFGLTTGATDADAVAVAAAEIKVNFAYLP